jgi:HlyD family secretion protein
VTRGHGPDEAPRLAGAIATGTGVILAATAALAVWAALARIEGAVIAPGEVVVRGDARAVAHPTGGRIAALAVAEGTTVAAGAVLLRFDDAGLAAELARLLSDESALMAVAARLSGAWDDASGLAGVPAALAARADADPAAAAAVAAERDLAAAEAAERAAGRAADAARITEIARRIGALDAEARATARQLSLVEDELQDQEALRDRGLTANARPRALAREAARLEGEAAAIAARRITLEAEIDAIRRAATAADTAWRTARARDRAATARALRDNAARQSDVARQLAALTLRAPIAGQVNDLRAGGPGAVLGAGAPALALVPEDRMLIVVARIAPHQIARIAAEHPVRLSVPGAQGTAAAILSGRIAQISPDTRSDPATGAPYFRAEILVDPPAIATAALRPGLAIDVLFATTAETPAALILAPLGDFVARAFRTG